MTQRYALRMTIQIAARLPDELVTEVDRLVRQGSFASRSEAVRSSLEAMVSGRRRQMLDEQYREALARMPEADDELSDAHRLAVEAINDEPWERWW